LAASIIRKKSEYKLEKDIKMSETNQKSFNAIIQKEGKFIFVAIPFSPREVWGSKPRYSVAGDINGIAVRGTLGALGQDYFLRLGAAWMRDSGIELGTNVSVRLSLEGPQESLVRR
jgi:hypothetical protein